jgi:hypothetical protein
VAKSKKGQAPGREIDEATKQEVQRLLGVQSDSAARFSGLSLFLKVSAGYAAMATFTMAALIFSAYHLYSINRTAFAIANVHLPVLSAVSKMRASLLAQESFAGKYLILKDPAFVQLFHQRDQESRTSLSVLEGVSPAKDVELLKRQYLAYQALAEKLFSEQAGNSAEVNTAANGVIDALDTMYVQRQQQLQKVLERADEQRMSAIGWTVVISGAGFLLALAVAVIVTVRILKSLRKMERVTHQILATSFEEGTGQRRGTLAGGASESQISARLKDLERRNFTTSGEIVHGGEEPSATSEPANR